MTMERLFVQLETWLICSDPDSTLTLKKKICLEIKLDNAQKLEISYWLNG